LIHFYKRLDEALGMVRGIEWENANEEQRTEQ